MNKRTVIFRFNLIEIALALVILAVGLSSVMVLFPVGMKASRAGVADNNMADIAERVAAYVQSKYTSSEMWNKNGVFKSDGAQGSWSTEGIGIFDPEPSNSLTSADFGTTEADDMDGLLTANGHPGYYLYRQYSAASGANRAVDFEAIVRVGWDSNTLKEQYYPNLRTGSWKKFGDTDAYKHTDNDSPEPGLKNSPLKNLEAYLIQDMCCRALIIEISWPADVPWGNRERRIFRVEMFNENFVPYPLTNSTP